MLRNGGIVARSLSKQFDHRGQLIDALADVSLAIHPGEFVTIVGPSGCGKSTMLRLISGLARPSSGEVAVDGRAVDSAVDGVGFVFQTPVLMKWKTVRQNVMFTYEALSHRKVITGPRRDYEQRATELLELVGLLRFQDSYPRELSGGMQQRVALCRALLTDPDILLMDEPFGALDEFTREQMNDELLKIWRRSPKTVVFVTHSIQEAAYLSDRVLVMGRNPGRIIHEAPSPLPPERDASIKTSVEFFNYSVELRTRLDTGA